MFREKYSNVLECADLFGKMLENLESLNLMQNEIGGLYNQIKDNHSSLSKFIINLNQQSKVISPKKSIRLR